MSFIDALLSPGRALSPWEPVCFENCQSSVGMRSSHMLPVYGEGLLKFHRPDGEAKFWLKPTIELARSIGLNSSRIKDAEHLIKSRQQEITDAWNNHFGS